MTSQRESNSASSAAPTSVRLPRPTLWPGVSALGMTLATAGLVSTKVLTIVGLLIAVGGGIGWFFQVLPREQHEDVPVVPKPVPVATSSRKVARIVAAQAPHRARLPLEIYPISAGIKGGLAGGVAMAALAMFYGIVSQRSIWYPINLLGAVVYEHVDISAGEIARFHLGLLLVATVLHLTTCILVGLLYGALLPMLPRRPILLGGIFAPLVWTGVLHSVLDIIDPLLNRHIDWVWFLVSQVAFGVVAGFVVVRQVRVPVWQYPLAVRAGVETPGMMGESDK